MASLSLEGLWKVHAGGAVAARGLSLEVADGELVVLVGPSGCGKSTALRLVAGLEAPDAGVVRIGGEDATDAPPRARDLAMVFQSYALYPHRSVRENLGFGLRMRRVPRRAREARVAEVARTLGLESLLERRPAQLSGGQRQRVALGRAIAREPRAFLLDEPLSNLDAKLRAQTRTELARLHRRLGATMLYVTHDQEEALTLGDRVAVMREGAIEQAGPPLAVYARPANAFVAGFVGAPAMNLLAAEGTRSPRGAFLRGPGLELPAPEAVAEGRALLVGVRPEDATLGPAAAPAGAGALAGIRGRVDVVEPLGAQALVHVAREAGDAVRVLVRAGEAPRPGRAVGVRVPPERVHLFDAATGARLELGPPGGAPGAGP